MSRISIGDIVTPIIEWERRKPRPTNRIYIAHFADDRIKVGVTKNYKLSIRDLEREAIRRRVHEFTVWGCEGFDDYEHLMTVSFRICKLIERCKVEGHHRWFKGGSEDFRQLCKYVERVRRQMERHMINQAAFINDGQDWEGHAKTIRIEDSNSHVYVPVPMPVEPRIRGGASMALEVMRRAGVKVG
jgi:hypothetical protein